MRSRIAILSPLLCVATVMAQSADWPQWRGPSRDGQSPASLPSTWPSTLTRRWEIPVGAGHASPVVRGDRVIVHTRQGDREITRAIDLASGKERWRDEYMAPYTMNPAARGHGPGPKSTPAIAGGRVVTLGISGILSALDLATGKVLWRTAAPPVPPEYGTAMSPVVEGPLVIAHVGGKDNGALTAFDAASGAVRWRWTGDGPGYASPVLATIAGTTHVITQSQRALVGVNATDGGLLWRVPLTTPYDQNSVTPVVNGDVVIYSGLDNGTTALRITRSGTEWTTRPVWENASVSMYMSSPIVSGNLLLGLSNRNRGQLFAMDLATGKTLWTTPGRDGENASLIAAGQIVLVSTTNAELIVARANPTRFEEVRRYTIAESAVWAHPALAPGTLLVKDIDTLIAWALP